jgi:hypothetical protein
VSERLARRLTVVDHENLTAETHAQLRTHDVHPPFRSHLPGLATRYLSSLAADAGRRGWSEGEMLGLLAAAEERCALWAVTARPLRRGPRVSRWVSGRWIDAASGGLDEVTAAAVSAPSRVAVCLAAVSGPKLPPRRLVAALERGGVQIGQVRPGLAGDLGAPWTIEVLVAPALAPGGLAGLRERIASAPRCAWCRIPVLGSSCPRCREAAP